MLEKIDFRWDSRRKCRPVRYVTMFTGDWQREKSIVA